MVSRVSSAWNIKKERNLIHLIDKRRPSFGLDAVEAARSLQQLSSSAGPPPSCYYYPPVNHHHPCCNPPNSNTTGGRVHRRTMSASIEMPAHPYHQQESNYHPLCFPYYHHQPQPQPQQQQQQPRRTRAHTTSGYPPTMLFQPQQPIYEQQETIKKDHQPYHRYHCHHCRKSFSRPSSLRIHIYSHTGEKPFKCHHQGCGRSFSVHSNMRRHLRVHFYPPNHQAQQLPRNNNNSSMRLPIVPTEHEEYQQQQQQEQYHHHQQREQLHHQRVPVSQ